MLSFAAAGQAHLAGPVPPSVEVRQSHDGASMQCGMPFERYLVIDFAADFAKQIRREHVAHCENE